MSFERSSPSALKLPGIYLGCRRIRYLYLTKSGNVRVPHIDDLMSETHTQGELIPLFLASDVLAGIAQLPKNYPRIHSRYSKEGMATKLKLLGHRIVDIANSQEVWFYSIQGLLKAVFEYHPRSIVRDCLMSLRELWIQRFEDALLPADADVNVETDTSCCRLREQVSSQGISTDCGVLQRLEPLSNKTVNKSLSTDMAAVTSEPWVQAPLKSANKLEDIKHQLENILQNVADFLDYSVESTEERSKLTVLQTTLKFCVVCFFTENYVSDAIFPVCLLQSYTNFTSQESEWKWENFENHFGIDPRKNFVLCVLSEWLGKEFSALEEKISERVASFKQSHIRQIDSLPTPQSIVDQLFPACMGCLLENWMGVHRTRYIPEHHNFPEKSHQSGLSDHNYIHQISQADSDPIPAVEQGLAVYDIKHYPFVQLILEFTNNCLISGVAHVLYSRLREGLI
ncbi:uncharacterized protein LOC135476812 [Liolophura sinensis]|uniref:uncharacterized protein LOC135476812 n=1 Tax=Liolophura sinensis TaxID=3198878 RepID=UPI003158FFD1